MVGTLNQELSRQFIDYHAQLVGEPLVQAFFNGICCLGVAGVVFGMAKLVVVGWHGDAQGRKSWLWLTAPAWITIVAGIFLRLHG